MATALSSLRQSCGRLLGMSDIAFVTGTPTGGYSTTAFQCSSLALEEDDFYIDWWLRIYSGTHKDTTRRVTDFAKSNGVVTFSPAVTADIDATDLFELHRDFTPEEMNAAINLAISAVETDFLIDKVDESLVVNDLLTDGLFEIWTSTSALTNWTTAGTGTLARESTIKLEGTYSAKLTNTASNAFSIQQSISNPKKFSGRTASLYARVNTDTADRARIRLTDGVNTWNSDYHDGTGWREAATDPWLSIKSVTLSTALTALTASVRVETGAAIDAYVDKMYLISGNKVYEYSVPTGFYTIDSITPESGTIGEFSQDDMLENRLWSILGTTTKKIWLDPTFVTITGGRKLRLEGQQKPGQLTLDADTTEVPAIYLVQQALAYLHQTKIFQQNDMHHAKMTMALAMAERERRGLQVPPRGWRV